MVDKSNSRPFQNGSDDLFRLENFACQLPCGARMARIIAIDLFHCAGHLGQGIEREQSAAAVMAGESGLLNDYRPAGGEVAAAAITEPSGIQTNVLILGDGELAFRSPDVMSLERVVGAQHMRA